MTGVDRLATPYAEADPVPEQPWRETSSPGIRRMAKEATAEAVSKAQGKPTTTAQEATK